MAGALHGRCCDFALEIEIDRGELFPRHYLRVVLGVKISPLHL
jgi:hypothetical protein